MTLSRTKTALRGTLQVPGDKSISHRAIMLGSLAEGTSELHHVANNTDCLSTIRCLQQLGVCIDVTDECVRVHGQGLKGLSAPSGILDCGNSATTMRLLAGILAGQSFSSELSGDASLSARPMRRIIDPLTEMGAKINTCSKRDHSPEECYAPLNLSPSELYGIPFSPPVASAQVKSAVLLAGLYASGETSVFERTPTRDHTERLLSAMGADIRTQDLSDNADIEIYTGRTASPESSSLSSSLIGDECSSAQYSATLVPGNSLEAIELDVPGDLSSAAYFIVAATLLPGSEICLEKVGINPTRDGILQVLQEMGADITVQNVRFGIEPSADLLIRSAHLHGTMIRANQIPSLIDELPILAVAATCAEGTTEVLGADELRHKETDRIQAIVEGLRAMGADIEGTDDGMIIHGGRKLYGTTINTFGDHRIAMAFSIASLLTENGNTLNDTSCISISYPSFFKDLHELGQP